MTDRDLPDDGRQLVEAPGIYVTHWLEHHVRCDECGGPAWWRRATPGLHDWLGVCRRCGFALVQVFTSLPAVE